MDVSKSLIAFFISLQIFLYQVLCLAGSGFPDANRILLCAGGITVFYFIFSLHAWRHSGKTLALSLVVALILGVFILKKFGLHHAGVAGGNGLFFCDFFSGDVTYCIDALFHSTIVESIKNYLVPSTLNGGVSFLRYHVLANWAMAFIAKPLGLSGFEMVGYIFPIICLPLITFAVIAAIKRIRAFLGMEMSFSLWDSAFILLFMLLPGFGVPLYIFCAHAESCLMGSLLLLFTIAYLPRIYRTMDSNSSMHKYIDLFVVVPLMIICATYAKVSAGFAVLSLVGGVLLFAIKWRDFRKSTIHFVAGLMYLSLFSCLYFVFCGCDQPPAYSSNFFHHFLSFCSNCVRNPRTAAFLFLPLTVFLLPQIRTEGKCLRFSFLLAIVASYIPYTLLRLHGGSEVWFWVNCQWLMIVYFIAVGGPDRLISFTNCSRMECCLKVACLLLIVCYVVKPNPIAHLLPRIGSVLNEAYLQPRPNDAIVRSTRFAEMERARCFISERGSKEILAYVTKDYWTAQSSRSDMAKAYIFAIQGYLGVPVIGNIKSDSQAVYVRKKGEWQPLEMPISYALDKYLTIPIPEYTLEEAKFYAAEHGYRYLMICGKNDKISFVDTRIKQHP